MQFLKGLWRAVTAAKNVTTNLIFLLIVGLIIAGLWSAETVTLPDKAALVIDPTGNIVEQKRAFDPMARLLRGSDEAEPESRLGSLQKAIETGASDNHIKALVLRLDRMDSAPMSMLEELGTAIDDFKASGKKVYAYAPGYSQAQYYLAAHADEIYLDKDAFQALGGVFLTGLGIYPVYFKSALDKLKIRYHVFRAGQFKSAVEPYIRDDMSEQAREENRSWLGVLWSDYRTTVTRQRGISAERFDNYTNHYDELLGENDNDSAKLALSAGLVDGLVSRTQFDDKLKDIVGDAPAGYSQISYRDYLRVTQPPIPIVNPTARKIAVITASGTILDGEQPAGNIGGETLAKLIKQARDDKTVKAVVLRVNSPGGSASAAERIRTELERTQQAGKPVVVSMSGYAASGGYWISATANRIFAQPTTVTGSIGTFMMFPTFDEGLAEIGIHSDGVGTTAMSDAMNPLRPLNPVLERTLKRSIANTYRRFIDLVAKGRDMSPEQVEKIAQGRVWSGQTALKLGLVDAIGNLQDAIKSAAVLAAVKDYDVLYLEQPLSPRDRLLNRLIRSSVKLAGGSPLGLAGTALGRVSGDITTLIEMSKSPGIYLQCLACNLKP